MVRQGNSFLLYQDGELIGQDTSVNVTSLAVTANTVLVFGGIKSSSSASNRSRMLDGLVDQIEIYDSALAQTQIRTRYQAFAGTGPATISLTNPIYRSIITGGNTTLGATLTNSAGTGARDLIYNMATLVTSGNVTLDSMTPAIGSLSPGASQFISVPVTSTNLGDNSITITAADPDASTASRSATATLTVFDHSNASLSSTGTQGAQTIRFGTVLKGASVPSQTFSIYNRAANTSAAYTADLKLTAFTEAGDTAIGTDLATFSHLAADSGITFTATLNTSSYTTTATKTIGMSASQLADDSTLPGATGNNNGGMTVTIEANVGNATADNRNSQTTFGTPLTALVAQNAGYASLESKVAVISGTSGGGMLVTVNKSTALRSVVG